MNGSIKHFELPTYLKGAIKKKLVLSTEKKFPKKLDVSLKRVFGFTNYPQGQGAIMKCSQCLTEKDSPIPIVAVGGTVVIHIPTNPQCLNNQSENFHDVIMALHCVDKKTEEE